MQYAMKTPHQLIFCIFGKF